MKTTMILVSCLFSAAVYGQETRPGSDGHTWEASYNLPTPEGWGVERFPIPINFAPEIPYQGIEDIRFTPGWAKVKSAEYWSYAFLWYLEGDIETCPGSINNDLKA